MLQIGHLKTERQWRVATGFDEARFNSLLNVFRIACKQFYGESLPSVQAKLEVTLSVTSEAELLYFTLFSLNAGLTYDLLDIAYGMNPGNAKNLQNLGLEVLQLMSDDENYQAALTHSNL